MTVQLPEPIPPRIARLPKDSRGYPVPRFVQWMKDGTPCARGEGAPDFRVIDSSYLVEAYQKERCWICGDRLGRHRVFVLGPMCLCNRVNSEPPSHRECAEFAVKVCPFLVKPRMRRLPTDDLPDMHVAGIMLDRNPGCSALYEVAGWDYRPFRAGDGVLFRLGELVRIDWWAEGRQATRAEVVASIDSGYPLLRDQAIKDGHGALRELETMRDAAMRLVPAEAA